MICKTPVKDKKDKGYQRGNIHCIKKHEPSRGGCVCMHVFSVIIGLLEVINAKGVMQSLREERDYRESSSSVTGLKKGKKNTHIWAVYFIIPRI